SSTDEQPPADSPAPAEVSDVPSSPAGSDTSPQPEERYVMSHMRLQSMALYLVLGFAMSLCVKIVITHSHTSAQMRTLVEDIGIDQHLNEQLPLDLEFTDSTGKRVKLQDYFGDKPVILTCVYYRCPMLCTQVLNGVLKSTNAMSLQMGQD